MNKKEFHDKLLNLKMKLALLNPNDRDKAFESVNNEIEKLKKEYILGSIEEGKREKNRK